MFQKLLGFYRPDTAAPMAAVKDQESHYRRLSLWVFISATLGYGLYYVCRLSFNIIKKPLIDEGLYTESQLGIIGSTMFFSYAGAKLINGFLADRSNIRRFMATGLFVSACVNIALGYNMSFIAFAILWGINGWAQSMGAPPSVIALTRWFNNKQRGTYYGFWSASHNIGEALTYLIVSLLVSYFGWRMGFWGAGMIGFIGVAIILFGLHDSPESKGITKIINPVSAETSAEDTATVSKLQRMVLKNPSVWLLALSSSCMYVTRYAINSWGIFFLETNKGYTSVQASSIVSVNAVCGIVGTVLSGLISDKLFNGKRKMPALIFGILNTVALCLFLFAPRSIIVDTASMILFGLSIGVLICFLGGLMAVDIVHKKATGAALGVVGIASYIGAGIQDIISGTMIENSKTVKTHLTNTSYDFSKVSMFWIAASVASFVLVMLIRNAKNKDTI